MQLLCALGELSNSFMIVKQILTVTSHRKSGQGPISESLFGDFVSHCSSFECLFVNIVQLFFVF